MSLSLVTGGAGFVGRRLVAALRARGETVRVLDLAPPENPGDIQGSVTDAETARMAARGVDTVFHLAGVAHLWTRDGRVFDRVNRGGTETVLAAAKKVGARRFVYCSSLTTLVGKNTPIGVSEADETIALSPGDMLGAYPRSKLEGERAVLAAAAEGFDAAVAIPTEPLGPGDAALTPPTQMILDFARGKTPAYIDCILNFVSVDDLAEGFIAVRDRGARGGRYILGGENVAMRALLDAVERLTGKPMPKTRLPYAVALAAAIVDTGLVAALTGKAPKAPLTGVRLAGRRVSFSSGKAERELGWRAGPYEPALAATLDWFKAEGLFD